MSSRLHSETGDFGFQVAPMVDVVFVLLLFFMACSGLGEKLLTIPVPGRGDKAPAPISIFVDIDAAGNVSVNGTLLAAAPEKDFSRLREFLAKTTQTSPEDSVIIRPHGDTRHEHVVAVVDACRASRVKKLIFS